MKHMMLILFCWSGVLLAQQEGEARDIDGQRFLYQDETWLHESLGDAYEVSERYAAVYRDKKWKRWYREGSPTLQKILALGPNVIFNFKGADGEMHVYSVFESKEGLIAALPPAAASAATAAARTSILGVSPTTAAVVGGAVVAGAIIVANNGDDGDVSPIRPKQ